MKYFSFSLSFPKITIFLFSFVLVASANHAHESFLECLTTRISKSNSTSTPESIIYTKDNPSYSTILNSTSLNPRFFPSSARYPLLIVTPLHASHVQATVHCAKKHGIQIRIRSGGHDYEGLSYMSNVTFAIVDLRNLSSIDVDVKRKSAWVQSGATLGELHYWIAKKSQNLAFPGVVGHTVGIGGMLGAGGYGYSSRKYGLSADNILDAQLIDVRGRILNRKSMGEDLFWAIRGGGAGSFGIVLAWKVRLVDVPSKVTVFTAIRDWDNNATKKFIHRYQRRIAKVDKDLTIIVRFLTASITDEKGSKKIQISTFITATYHGSQDRLLSLMEKEFPELGLLAKECAEGAWVQSILYFNLLTNSKSLDVLLNRTLNFEWRAFKIKSDYLKKPIPDQVLENLLVKLYEEDIGETFVEFFPYGGKLDEISESEIPCPHRAGNLYNLRYMVLWKEGQNATAVNKHLSWIRRAYNYMTPYVSKNPRGAFLNFRDLDIGTNPNENEINGAYNYIKQASNWGTKYFKNNFYKLIYVKTIVDPTNFFTYEQSIPSLLPH
uniref:MaDA-3 n=1 Tax=Morus alba TaxID=3498 RepID=UPI001E1C222D|nr:diels-alderase [Morus alba]7E2V_A Chain A, MaDA-3 [Morus alba]7E2V_B Chain B, MaDA-3 [Morus alba]